MTFLPGLLFFTMSLQTLLLAAVLNEREDTSAVITAAPFGELQAVTVASALTEEKSERK